MLVVPRLQDIMPGWRTAARLRRPAGGVEPSMRGSTQEGQRVIESGCINVGRIGVSGCGAGSSSNSDDDDDDDDYSSCIGDDEDDEGYSSCNGGDEDVASSAPCQGCSAQQEFNRCLVGQLAAMTANQHRMEAILSQAVARLGEMEGRVMGQLDSISDRIPRTPEGSRTGLLPGAEMGPADVGGNNAIDGENLPSGDITVAGDSATGIWLSEEMQMMAQGGLFKEEDLHFEDILIVGSVSREIACGRPSNVELSDGIHAVRRLIGFHTATTFEGMSSRVGRLFHLLFSAMCRTDEVVQLDGLLGAVDLLRSRGAMVLERCNYSLLVNMVFNYMEQTPGARGHAASEALTAAATHGEAWKDGLEMCLRRVGRVRVEAAITDKLSSPVADAMRVTLDMFGASTRPTWEAITLVVMRVAKDHQHKPLPWAALSAAVGYARHLVHGHLEDAVHVVGESLIDGLEQLAMAVLEHPEAEVQESGLYLVAELYRGRGDRPISFGQASEVMRACLGHFWSNDGRLIEAASQAGEAIASRPFSDSTINVLAVLVELANRTDLLEVAPGLAEVAVILACRCLLGVPTSALAPDHALWAQIAGGAIPEMFSTCLRSEFPVPRAAAILGLRRCLALVGPDAFMDALASHGLTDLVREVFLGL